MVWSITKRGRTSRFILRSAAWPVNEWQLSPDCVEPMGGRSLPISQVYTRSRSLTEQEGITVRKRIAPRWWIHFLMALAVFVQLRQAAGQTPSANTRTDAQVRDKASNLLRQMTLDEKIAQLSQLPGFPVPEFKENVSKTLEEILKQVGAGSILWVSDPKEINRLQHVAVEQSRLHIPVLFGLDVIHGYHTIFPAPIAMASSWDTKMVDDAQTVAAREARAAGIQWTFAPMVDIARDARWGRMVEGAGEDPYLGAAIARAQVLGFQGKQPGAPDRVLACVKHFAGYGAADGGRDYDSSYIPEERLWNVYLPPFEAAVRAGSGSLMTAYMDLNDVPATGNNFLLHDVLRNKWKFNGFVVSDWESVQNLTT